jgi:hypothetical protein
MSPRTKKEAEKEWVEGKRCPRCHWNTGVPARRKAIDWIARLLFLYPFRCRSCHKRFFAFRRSKRSRR